MKSFKEFKGVTSEFWAFVRFVSETLGYSERGMNVVKEYSFEEIAEVCDKYNVNASQKLIENAVFYSKLRAGLLNNFVESMLMDAQQANSEFLNWEQLHRINSYMCKLPFNKQKGPMRQIAFFTSIINIM